MDQETNDSHSKGEQLKMLNHSKLMIAQIHQNKFIGANKVSSPVSHRGPTDRLYKQDQQLYD